MDYKKASVDGKIRDVIDYSELPKINTNNYDNLAVLHNGVIYPERNPNVEISPGLYVYEWGTILHEPTEEQLPEYLAENKLIDFKEKKEYLYNRVKDVRFSEFQKLYKYLEGQTPFSTQHKTKGTEFNNVLVILDNGGWNNYNFGNLFLDTGSASVLDRTQKIFYVCCTRAKENLAVFFHNPDAQVIAKAREWFGNDNVINVLL